MNYPYIYFKLICKRIENPISKNDCYVEKHHIVPRSEGGSNDSWNLVNLTAREHYIAHLLLAKIYDDAKMYKALTYMQCRTPTQSRHTKFNNRLYQLMRIHMYDNIEYVKMLSDAGRKSMTANWKNPNIREKLLETARENGRKTGKKSLGMKFWNNGVINKRSKECPGEGWVRGVLLSEETLQKRKENGRKSKGRKRSEEYKAKLRYSIQHSEKRKATMASKEYRQKMSDALKGKCKGKQPLLGCKWWNNGIETKLSKECPGPNFVPGRLSGSHWWNNDIETKLSKECPGPEWKRGRL